MSCELSTIMTTFLKAAPACKSARLVQPLPVCLEVHQQVRQRSPAPASDRATTTLHNYILYAPPELCKKDAYQCRFEPQAATLIDWLGRAAARCTGAGAPTTRLAGSAQQPTPTRRKLASALEVPREKPSDCAGELLVSTTAPIAWPGGERCAERRAGASGWL